MPPEIRFVPDACAEAIVVPLMLTKKGERANVQNEILQALGQMTTRRNHERKRNTRKRSNARGHKIGESISQFLATRRSKLERSRRRDIAWRKRGRICDEARGPWEEPSSLWTSGPADLRFQGSILRTKYKSMEPQLFMSVQTLEKMLWDCKLLQIKRTVESASEQGQPGRMSFCDLLIGPAMHNLAPSRQPFAVDGRDCNEQITHLVHRISQAPVS